MKQARVLTTIGDLDGCALWRCLLPITELQRQGYAGIEWIHKDDRWLDKNSDIIPGLFDAVVIPRQHWETEQLWAGKHYINALHNAGLAVIYEIDDDLFSDGFVNRLVDLHGYTPEDAETRRDNILYAVRLCDGVTVSSQRVASILRNYVDMPIKVVPNYIDLNWWKRIQSVNKRDPKLSGLTIGWAGGNRPDSDVESMAKAWGILADKFPQVTFVIQGHHAKAFYDNVPNERIAMIDWLPIEQYPAGLVNVDIGCCPLGDTKFNRAKTHIKAMEYAASGAVVVASPTVYGSFIDHGVDGYIARSVDDWIEYLSALVENAGHRKAMAARLLDKIQMHHSLEANAWRWVVAWSGLVDDFRKRNQSQILIPKGVNMKKSEVYEHA